MSEVPKFCELCGRALYLFQSPAGYYWMRCPKWPKRGEHWWSPETPVEHSYINVERGTLAPPKYDRMTGAPIP